MFTRRDMLRAAGAVTAASTLPFGMGGEAQAQAAAGRNVLRIIPHASLTILDPIATTGYIVRNHGYMVYDTLFALDDQLRPQPQMVGSYDISPDRLTYRMTLRDGLAWHDGADVTAEDCIASLVRWGKVDGMGVRLFSYIDTLTADGAKTIVLKLKKPYGLVLDSIGKISSNVPFMMPKRFADKPHTERLTADDMIGSGPFIFVKEEFRQGARVVYRRNPNYKPRTEAVSSASGGKRALVERVEWITFPDPTTAMNALISGEVDYYEQVPADLVPIVSRAPGIKVEVLDTLGNLAMARFNHTVAPTNNVLVRRAIMKAINQEDFLRAAVGSPEFFRTCHSVYPCGSAFETDAGSDFIKRHSIADARALLQEGKYNNEKLVLLATSDIPIQTAFAQVLADTCKRIGINVEAQSMDWATVLQRRVSRQPIDAGGWNIFVTWWIGGDLVNPLTQIALAGTGDRAWVGWSSDTEIETLRQQFAETADAAEQRRLAGAVQQRAFDQGFQAYLGQFFVPVGYRDSVKGMIRSPVQFFWNMEKVSA